ncbi:helix-turn-helix transcriptional regulator [Ferrovibrio sp.]|uniref:helix-turn-helix domain-containing protein n=1 Tax=Ferrovibrio sp. TaxID=1917215 RepID=UPI0025C2A7F2|nr:helix-turn-helix transcriptional regulator [Ferrovibrio sp.]MBX3455605.1 helix-turn-helix transcriptional regulator [Ferrovibrio sp.]
MTESGLTIEEIAEYIGRDPSSIRAWRRGAAKPSFEAVDAMDRLFARHGLPGLIDDMRTAPNGRDWHFEAQTLDEAAFRQLGGMAGRLAELAPGLRAQPAEHHRLLAENGLLQHCHIFSHTDDCWRLLQLGDAMASRPQIDSRVLGRDVREFADSDYGEIIHQRNNKARMTQLAMVEHIVGRDVEYRRLVVPIDSSFIVACSFDIRTQPQYRLACRS